MTRGKVQVDGGKEKRQHILINVDQQLKTEAVKPNNGHQTEIPPALEAITLPEISGPISVGHQIASETSFADAVCP